MSKIKKYALWILGILVAILVAVLGIDYERRKIQELKRQVELSKADRRAMIARALKDVHLQREKALKKKDFAIGKRVEVIEKDLAEVTDLTKDMTGEEISNQFNDLYNRSGVLRDNPFPILKTKV